MGLLVGAGIVLLATGLLIVVGAGPGDDMHRKMPFQERDRAGSPRSRSGGRRLAPTLAGALALLP